MRSLACATDRLSLSPLVPTTTNTHRTQTQRIRKRRGEAHGETFERVVRMTAAVPAQHSIPLPFLFPNRKTVKQRTKLIRRLSVNRHIKVKTVRTAYAPRAREPPSECPSFQPVFPRDFSRVIAQSLTCLPPCHITAKVSFKSHFTTHMR